MMIGEAASKRWSKMGGTEIHNKFSFNLKFISDAPVELARRFMSNKTFDAISFPPGAESAYRLYNRKRLS